MTKVSCSSDVVVVGTGVLGMTIALHAADQDLSTILVGPGPYNDEAASPAAGAMFGVLGEHIASATSTLDRADLQFRYDADQRWPDFAARLTEAAGALVSVLRGTVIIANLDNHADHANLDAIGAVAHQLNQPVTDVDPRDINGLHPAPRYLPTAALYLPDEGWIDTTTLLPALQQACANHPSIDRRQCHVTKVQTGTDVSVRGVELDDGNILHTRHVILAAGAATGRLLTGLPHLDTLPALRGGKGVSITLDVEEVRQPPYVIRTPNRDFSCGYHLVPRDGGGLYVGATNRIGDTPGAGCSATAGELANLLHGLLHQLRVDLRNAPVVSYSSGLRPASADGYPLIGPTELPGLHLATGTYRNGILMAPAVAHVTVAALTGSAPDIANPFSPIADWRGRPVANLPQVIADGATHLASFLTEPGGHLPYSRQAELTAFLTRLLHLVLTPDTTDVERLRLHDELVRHPVPETIGEIYYQLVNGGPN